MQNIREFLAGGDLRSIGRADELVAEIKSQKDFDALFECLYDKDRVIVMRAIDAAEKVSELHPEYLKKYREQIFELSEAAEHKEQKWHLAFMLARLELEDEELDRACNVLTEWAKDKNNSRIVRVNAMHVLYTLSEQSEEWREFFLLLLPELEQENIPSMSARIRLIRKDMKRKAKDRA
jgi:hypothetical protein